MEEEVSMNSILLLVNVPPKSEIGLDMKNWIAPDKFYGVKNIPSGFHIFYSRSGESNHLSGLRISHPFTIGTREIVKFDYCKEKEEFIRCPLTQEETNRIHQNEELPHMLPEYPKDLQRSWLSLSCFISYELVSKHISENSPIYSCDFLQSIPSNSHDRLAENYQVPEMKEIEEMKLNFVKIPKHSQISSLSPKEITLLNMDKSDILRDYLDKFKVKTHIMEKMVEKFDLTLEEITFLSELQFSFIVVLVAQNMSGWYQWRDILTLISFCEEKIRSSPQFFKYIIFVLYHQMLCDDPVESLNTHGDTFFSLMAEAFSDEETKVNIISVSLKRIFSNIFNTVEDLKAKQLSEPEKAELKTLTEWSEGFRKYLQKRFTWDLSFHRNIVCQADENGDLSEIPIDSIDWDTEDAPVIVS